jgi:tetratricopeptide (TPR) repeat protein
LPNFRVALFLLGLGAAFCAAAQQAATVVSLQGRGEMRRAEGDWRAVRVGDALAGGDFVRTGDGSKLGLLFADQTQLRLNENSMLQIKPAAPPPAPTGVRLNSGRAWTQAKPQLTPTAAPSRPPQFSIDTPSATLSIRGTDWEVEVGPNGRTQLAVLHGAVEMANEHGAILAQAGEGGVAEVGKPPVKIVLVRPRERVQWVSAQRFDPARHLRWHGEKSTAELRALSETGSAIDRAGALLDLGRWREARQRFVAAAPDPLAALGVAMADLLLDVEKPAEVPASVRGDHRARLAQVSLAAKEGRVGDARKLLGEPGAAPDAGPLLATAELRMVEGRLADAIALTQRAEREFPRSARAAAESARYLLLDDRAPEAAQAAARGRALDREDPDALLAEAAVGLFNGDSAAVFGSLESMTKARPEDSRGWLGLGVAQAERENVSPAREGLERARTLAPRDPRPWGELGTLEAFADRFGPAAGAFEEALRRQPDDYASLTGRGFMKLKQGETDAALEDFLKASLIEPNYARARLYAGVAYYQLGRYAAAMEEFARAAELDPRDPLPHLYSAIAHGDFFDPSRAVAAARAALERMPYLKSLNQVANNQKGVANVGTSLSFWGMREWATSYAQNTDYPFWGGSHLFLADMYDGAFIKNSELFQGFLADPTVFGASTRYQTLVHRPGHYQALTLTAARDREVTEFVPRVTLNGYTNSLSPIAYFLELDQRNADSRSDEFDYQSKTPSITAALGWKPTHDLRLFAFYNRDDTSSEFQNTTIRDLRFTNPTSDSAIGGSYYFTPTAMLQARAGRNKIEGTQDWQQTVGAFNVLGHFDDEEDSHDEQIGFTWRPNDGWQVQLGAEQAKNPEASALTFSFAGAPPVARDAAKIDEKSEVGYLSLKRLFSPTAMLQLDVAHTDYSKVLDGTLLQGGVQTNSVTTFTREGWTPRVGVTLSPADRHLLRYAYQHWIRTSSPATLAPVATAGIPLDETFVRFGGELHRNAAKLESEWNPRLYTELSADFQRARNLETIDLSLSEVLANLVRIRQKSLTEVTDFYAGASPQETTNAALNSTATMDQARFAVNAIVSDRQTVTFAYANTDSTMTLAGDDRYFLPRHQVRFGTTWVGPSRWRFAFEARWRSEAWTFVDISQKRDEYWNGAASAYWETTDKRLSFAVFAKELFSPHESAFYGLALAYKH